jgi:hypothetical protein
MKNRMLLAASFAAVSLAAFSLAACSKSATVQDKGGGSLTLVKPDAVVLHRGEMVKTDIKIRREDLAGDVTIRFSNLPSGVDVVESDSKIVGDRGSYTLRASDTADLVEKHAAQVTATGGPGAVGVSEPFTISVRNVE